MIKTVQTHKSTVSIAGISLLVLLLFYIGCSSLQQSQKSLYTSEPTIDSAQWAQLSSNKRRDSMLQNSHPPFEEEHYQQWTLDNNIDFVCGFTYYLLQKNQREHELYSTVGSKMKVLKGNAGIVKGRHQAAKDNPSKTVKHGLEGFLFHQKHTEQSFESMLIDSNWIQRRDPTSGKMKKELNTKVKRPDGIEIRHENLLDNENGQMISRMNFLAMLEKQHDQNGNYRGFEPLYAFPFEAPWRSKDTTQAEHPFGKKSIKWGVKTRHSILRDEEKGNLQLENSATQKIDEGSIASLGMELQRAREKGALDLYHSYACNRKNQKTYSRDEIYGYIIREIFYYNRQGSKGNVRVTKVGVLAEKNKNGKFVGFEELFWAKFMDQE